MNKQLLTSAIRSFAHDRHYRDATIERWLTLAETEGVALLELARDLRLGENQLRDLWDWAEEIATRDSTSLAAVLGSDTLVQARRREVGRNDRLKLVKAALRRQRYPQLSAVEERLGELIRQLDLPRSVRVALPDNLEGESLSFEITATDTAALREAAARIQRAVESAACAEIFRLLEEAP